MNSELETTLTKAIYAYKVRDMLTKFGIPEDVEVTLKMLFGDNPEPKAICPVPTAVRTNRIQSSMSLKELQDSLAEDFINPAIYNLDLSSYFPEENNLTVNLSYISENSKMELSTLMICRPGGCPWPWCGV